MKNVAVIGAGPGGYVAAIRLAQLGANVHLFEKDSVGGTCLNRGCIPTKTLFRTAEILHDMRRSAEFGISINGVFETDYASLFERKEQVVKTLVGGIEMLIKSYPNIVLHRALVRLSAPNTVECDGEVFSDFDAVIIASGSAPQMTETQGVDLEGVITSDELLELKTLPKRLIVVGGGVIGLEFASIYRELGSKVVVLASRILKNADAEISKRLAPMLKKQGIELYNDVRARRITKNGEFLKVEAASKKNGETFEVEGDYVLIASGRRPVYEGIDLEALGVEFDEKGIVVDKNFQTSAAGVFAIGDIVRGNPQLAHVASAQGEYVAEYIMGHQPKIILDVYPNCVFTLNEVAHAGATEEELKERGVEYRVSKFNFAANGKALSIGDTNGLVKILAAADGKILGAHIIGPHANDLIAECTLAIARGMSAEDLAGVIHAHPTLSEAVLESVSGIFGGAIHIANSRKK